MNAASQDSPELSHICKLIAHISTATLTAFDAERALVSLPMIPLEMDDQGALWLFADLRSTTADLRSTTAERLRVVSLRFIDPVRPTYVELSGMVEIQFDHTRVERLRIQFAKPTFAIGPGLLNLTLLKFVLDRAEYWDAPLSKMVRMFAVAMPRFPPWNGDATA